MQDIIDTAGHYALVFILAIFAALVQKYAVPYLKKLTEEKAINDLKARIDELVLAAEERFGPKTGRSDKKPWVQVMLRALGYVVDEYADALIDSSVKALRDATAAIEKAAAQARADA